jgi:magnesium chelatase family protein
MARARTHSVAISGVEGHPVVIEACVDDGLPGLLLDGAVAPETRDRIRAAVINSGEAWPHNRITVELSPSSSPGGGNGFDLGIAVAIVAAAGAVPMGALDRAVFIGELGLGGSVHPVRGVLPAVAAAAAAGFGEVAVSAANAAEAALVPAVRVIGVPDLSAALAWIRGDRTGPGFFDSADGLVAPLTGPVVPSSPGARHRLDTADVAGQPMARRAAEICAAGGHHLLLSGPPGAGRMLAGWISSILPPLDLAAALEVTSIHSIAGVLKPGSPLITRPQLCGPHHTATKAAILGGGSEVIHPGAASLAHQGILLLD